MTEQLALISSGPHSDANEFADGIVGDDDGQDIAVRVQFRDPDGTR